MTLYQFRTYVKSASKQRLQDHVNMIAATRLAHHADNKDYGNAMDKLTRDLKS